MKMIKIELKKAFTGSRFWLAFCIGQFLGISSILTVYRSWLSQRDYIQYWENRFPVRQAYTLYNVWMLNEQLSIGRTLFFFWLPFLAAFPFAASYYQEEKKKAENTIQLFHRLVEDYNISEPVREKMEVWFRYKMERKESYKEQGMKSLLKKTENNEGSYGANEICNLIEDCMANNWKGIIWKILEERKQQRPATRTEQIQQRVSEVDSW
mgnify:CR=1 FL=1